MANRCDCCGKEFSVKKTRKHIKNYEMCADCAGRLNVGDENSIKAIQEEAAILAKKSKRKGKRKKKLHELERCF